MEARISALESEVFRLRALEAEVARLKAKITDDQNAVDQYADDYQAIFGTETGNNPCLTGDIPGSVKQSSNDSETGNIPCLTGIIPGSETVGIEQKTITDVQKVTETGDFPVENGNILPETGDFTDLIINSKNELCNTDFKHVYLLIDSARETENIPGDDIPGPAVTAWRTALSQMKGNMDKQTFSTLLATAELFGYVNGHFTIRMQNSFTKDWAENRLTGIIEKILSSILGAPQSVSFICNASSAVFDPLKEQKETAKSRLFAAEAKERRATWEKTHLTMPENPDSRTKENVEICNDYLDHGQGMKFSVEELQEIVMTNPDPDVLYFVLPRASGPEALRRWAFYDLRHLKYHLMKDVCDIRMPALKNFTNDEKISPALIDYHYWNWFLKDRQENPDHKAGWFVDLIRKGVDRMIAESDEPQKYEFLQ